MADDIFEKAAQDSIKNSLKAVDPMPIEAVPIEDKEDETLEELALMHTSSGDKWDDIASFINGSGADRFLREIKACSSKDYIRNYLKILEHFKPKLTRADISPEDEADRSIEIELVQKLPSGEIRTVTINKKEDGK